MEQIIKLESGKVEEWDDILFFEKVLNDGLKLKSVYDIRGMFVMRVDKDTYKARIKTQGFKVHRGLTLQDVINML